VSLATVSHALSGRRAVSTESKDKVMAAVATLGYRPNLVARSMRTQKTWTVALVIPDIANPFYPEFARGVQSLITEHGYQLFICNTEGSVAAESAYLRDAIDRRVDGVIYSPVRTPVAGSITQLLQAQIPAVQMAADLGELAKGASFALTDYVHSDDEGGMTMATEYLLAQGHIRVGFINGPLGTGPSGRRRAGYSDAVRNRGLEPNEDLIATVPFNRAGGVEGAQRLLDLQQPPTAVVCANDLIAIGALDAARYRGLRVPEDLAVVGFDDIEAASLVSPALTTILNPAHEIGHICGRLLLDRTSGGYTGAPREVSVATTLVRRASA